MSDSESEETSLSSLGELLRDLVCPFLGPRDLALLAVSSRAMRQIAMADVLWNPLTTRAFPYSDPRTQNCPACPRDYRFIPPAGGAARFVHYWKLHLDGYTPAHLWLFRDPALRRIEKRRKMHNLKCKRDARGRWEAALYNARET